VNPIPTTNTSSFSIEESTGKDAPLGSIVLMPSESASVLGITFNLDLGFCELEIKPRVQKTIFTLDGNAHNIPALEVDRVLIIAAAGTYRIIPAPMRATLRLPKPGDVFVLKNEFAFPIKATEKRILDDESRTFVDLEFVHLNNSGNYATDAIDVDAPTFVMPWQIAVGDEVIFSHPAAV
jgi:hypothetical protein